MNDIIERYSKAKIQLSKLHNLREELKELDKRIYTNNLVTKRLKATLDKEYKEYKQLEEKTIISMFHSMLGNIEEKIEQEKQEYIEAKFEYEQSIQENEMLILMADELKQMISIITGVEPEYEVLKKERDEYLLSGTDEKAKEYQAILEQISDLEIVYNNTDELYQAAVEIKKAINAVIGILTSTENWATYDMMGRNTFVTNKKYSKISDAQMQIIILKHQANNFLQKYNNTTLNINSTFNISDGMMLADFVLDGFFVDYMVFDKIASMKHNIDDIASSFRKIEKELFQRKQAIANAKEELQAKML